MGVIQREIILILTCCLIYDGLAYNLATVKQVITFLCLKFIQIKSPVQ